ncbi:MAG: NlpC/P60 family protein [Corynebacterium sp.]|nr:NlpC/P60 family protein [Corynebacterium sp.]
MAKHRRQSRSARRIVTTTAVAASAAALATPAAHAAEVVIPNSDITFQVQGLENVPNINQVPNIAQFVPSLNGQSNSNLSAPIAAASAQAAPAPAAAPAKSKGEAIVAAARTKIGSPYGWGSAGPASFDCSGLTSWAYSQVGISIPRTSQAQAAQGTRVAISDLQPGDIVAFYGGASHVGIYVGNGKIIDSLNTGSTVQERPLNYMPIHSAVRF